MQPVMAAAFERHEQTGIHEPLELRSPPEKGEVVLARLPVLAIDRRPAAAQGLRRGVGATVADRLNEEARTVSELSGTADSLEGLAAVIEKRSPRFEGR